MLYYIFRKILFSGFTLFVISLGTFLMARAIPGGPFDSEKVQPAHIRKLQEEKYGFDKPPLVHFFTYAKGVILHADFGESVKFVDRPVATILKETAPISFSLGFLALIFAVLVGIPMGILSAAKPNSIFDTASVFLAVSGVTLPTFLIGAFLVLIFCNGLNWLPPARLDGPEYFILPMVTLGLRPAAIIARLIRTTLMEQMKMDYVRTARAKGLPESRILLRHAFRNSLVPVVAVLGPIAATILTGSFITEHFFAISGMAKHFINAVTNRDVFLMVGVTLVFATTLIFINLVTDLIYPFLDPRMELQ